MIQTSLVNPNVPLVLDSPEGLAIQNVRVIPIFRGIQIVPEAP